MLQKQARYSERKKERRERKEKKEKIFFILSTYNNIYYMYTYSNGALEDVYKFPDGSL